MAKTQKFSLIVAASLLPLVSLPRSCVAQSPSTIYGEWYGHYSYNATYEPFAGGSYTFSGSGEGVLDVDDYSGYLTITLPGRIPYWGAIALAQDMPPDVFGPTSATGTMGQMYDFNATAFGNFFLTYQSVLPDGAIFNPETAAADVTMIGTNYGYAGRFEGFASFVAVIPEPPSGILAASAMLAIGAVAGIRAILRKSKSRPSSATQ
jgi:hypothetical protein